MTNLEKAISTYSYMAETLRLRAEELREASARIDAVAAERHLRDASTLSLIVDVGDDDAFVEAGSDVRGSVLEVAAILSSRRAA